MGKNKVKGKMGVSIVIKQKLNEKLNWFVNNYEYEIGGFLIGEVKENVIILEDLLIPYQEVGHAEVNTSPKSLIKLRKEYGDRCLKILGHWHSHNTMGAYWSQTDEQFIKEYADTREKSVFIVSSKGENHLVRLELRNPFKLSFNNLNYSIDTEGNDKLSEELQKIIDEKVEVIKQIYYSNYTNQIPIDSEKVKNKRIKERVRELINFNKDNMCISISPLNWIMAEQLETELKESKFKFKLYTEKIDNHKIVINFNNLNEMIDKVKEISQMVRFLIEEDEEEQYVEDYDPQYVENNRHDQNYMGGQLPQGYDGNRYIY